MKKKDFFPNEKSPTILVPFILWQQFVFVRDEEENTNE